MRIEHLLSLDCIIFFLFCCGLPCVCGCVCDEQMSLEIKIENDTYALSIKKINQLEVNLNNTDDPVSIAVLDLIFTHNLNYT